MIIKLYIFITLIFYFTLKKKNRILGFLLLAAASNEVINFVLQHFNIILYGKNNAYIFLHQILWLLLLKQSTNRQKLHQISIIVFALFSAFSFYFVVFKTGFNYDVFVMGAFLYLTLFIYESYLRLKNEELSFFLSNDYLLLFAPILFFLGMSFMFSFKSHSVTSTLLFNDIKLYTVISYFVNIVYYTTILVYIFKEKKSHNAA